MRIQKEERAQEFHIPMQISAAYQFRLGLFYGAKILKGRRVRVYSGQNLFEMNCGSKL